MSEPNTGSIGADSASTGVSSVMKMEKSTTSSGTSQQQYKIVKVRKPDGTIVEVRRPITAEESAQLALAKPKSIPASTTPVPAKNAESAITVTSVPIHEESVTNVTTTETTLAVASSTSKKESITKVTIAGNMEEANSSFITTSSSTVAKSNKTAKKSKEFSKPAESSTTTKTDEALNTAAKGSRFYRGLHKLHKGSSRIVTVLTPEWDVGDWQEGDEEYDDDFSDGDDNEQYDSDDERPTNNNQSNNNIQAQSGTSINANAAAHGVVVATTTTVTAPKTTKIQPGDHPKTTTPPPVTKPKKTTVVSEKEVFASDSEKGSLEKPVSPTTEGKNLKIRYKDWSRYVVWSIMIIFPLLFIAVGILVAARDGQDADDSIMSGTDQALEVAISVWPIIFAGIVAQSLRAYATYRVERGVRLMTLEQLVNSNSVASSIKQPFLLRRFNAITIALLMLWGLSPLATQAMQRISSTSTKGDPVDVHLDYINTAMSSSNFISASTDIFNGVEADFNRLYVASFLPQGNINYGTDAFNNPLIPKLKGDTHDWVNTDPTNADFTAGFGAYASAYGIPIDSPKEMDDVSAADYYSFDLSSTFDVSIPAAYLDDFKCDALQAITSDNVFNNSDISGGPSQYSLLMSMTAMSNQTRGTVALASRITSNITTNTTNNDLYAYTECSFTQLFVDLNISCQDTGCYTYAARKSPSTNSTFGFSSSGAMNFARGIVGTSGDTNSSSITTPTDTEKFLISEDGNILKVGNNIDLTTANPETFEQNLAYLMNTFWSIGFAPQIIASSFPDPSPNPFQQVFNTPGIMVSHSSHYTVSWGWFAALMVCSTFLLLAGIFSIWWDARSVSPDVLGFASTVVRKSKYVKLPPVDSSASGAERARALGEIRVMMQDVKPNAEVGRIALGTVHPDAKRLQPGRAYR